VHEDVRPLLVRTRAMPLHSRALAASALGQLRASPGRGAKLLARVAHGRSQYVVAKNLAVYPKGLWLASLARDLDADHIHAHWAGTSATVAMIAAEVAGIPWSMTAHRWDIRENNLLGAKVQSAAFVRGISRDGLRDLERTVGPTATRTVLIHMGVDLPGETARVRGLGQNEPLRVLVPANLLEVKGHRYLVEAVAILGERGIPVLAGFAGRGPLRASLEAQIAALGLQERCVLLGQLSHHELIEQLAAGAWDAVAMPSIETPSGEKEGIPVGLLEAMSHGVPVMGSDAGGVPELLAGGSGLLVPPADPAALAGAIEQLATDETLRAELGRLGRKHVEREFAAPVVTAALVAEIEATLPRS
jgi:colanic acid/amylovoran biosynthesis glycosyltransferase